MVGEEKGEGDGGRSGGGRWWADGIRENKEGEKKKFNKNMSLLE